MFWGPSRAALAKPSTGLAEPSGAPPKPPRHFRRDAGFARARSVREWALHCACAAVMGPQSGPSETTAFASRSSPLGGRRQRRTGTVRVALAEPEAQSIRHERCCRHLIRPAERQAARFRLDGQI